MDKLNIMNTMIRHGITQLNKKILNIYSIKHNELGTDRI